MVNAGQECLERDVWTSGEVKRRKERYGRRTCRQAASSSSFRAPLPNRKSEFWMPRTGAQSCLWAQQDKAYNSSHWRCPSKPWKSEIFYQSTLPSLSPHTVAHTGKYNKGKTKQKIYGKRQRIFRGFSFLFTRPDPITSVAWGPPPSPRFIFLSISNLFFLFQSRTGRSISNFSLRFFFFPPFPLGALDTNRNTAKGNTHSGLCAGEKKNVIKKKERRHDLREEDNLTIYSLRLKECQNSWRVANVEPFLKSGRVRETDEREGKKGAGERNGRFDAHATLVHYTFSAL